MDNSTGGSLAAGTLVYISGYDASTGAPQVTKADADSRMAEYVLQAAIADGAAGYAFRGYTLGSQDTSGSSVAMWSICQPRLAAGRRRLQRGRPSYSRR